MNAEQKKVLLENLAEIIGITFLAASIVFFYIAIQ